MAFPTQTMPVASASVDERAAFLVRTYLHLAGAVFAFVALEAFLFTSGAADSLVRIIPQGRLGWILVLGAFMGVSWLANKWALNAASIGKQYAGLSLYVVAEAIIFLPLLYAAARFAPDAIPTAGLVTLMLFSGLTAVVFITRKDFSFLRGILMLGGFAAIGLIVAGAIFGFQLGVIFSWAMVALASGYVLYTTSNILHHYRTTQHVAAALALFAAIALMFWYILRIFLGSRR